MKKIILFSLSFLLMGMLFNLQKITAQEYNPEKQYASIQFNNHSDVDLTFECYGPTNICHNDLIIKAGTATIITVEKGEYDFHIFMVNQNYPASFDFSIYGINDLIDSYSNQSHASCSIDLVYSSYTIAVSNHY